jgi:hypothetical protein
VTTVSIGSRIRRGLSVVSVGMLILLTGACGSDDEASPPDSSASESTSAGESPSPSSTTSTAPALPSGYLPLYPFSDSSQVVQWQEVYRAQGSQPWHMSAEDTALSFAQSLGYAEIDRVTSAVIRGDDAEVGVGWVAPEETPNPITVGIVHLKRFGTGPDAPWEVVGTKDKTLTLTTPKYRSTVTSPVTVGGRITGVDESMVVTVHDRQRGIIARSGPVHGGGQDHPWSTRISFTGSPGQVLVIAVYTGGHLREVEQFAVTGVRVGG